MTDPDFEAMLNLTSFALAFNTERPRKLTYRKYFNQMLMADLHVILT